MADSAIVSLKANQVFVFGSNAAGFHGAGAAGFACRGDAANNWRNDPWFLRAKESRVGSPDRVGKWAVYGVARGLQQGRDGKSYAIQTITAPGHRRSVPLADIEEQFVELFVFAETRPDLEFLVTPVGSRLAGYTPAEIKATFSAACRRKAPPANIVVPPDLSCA